MIHKPTLSLIVVTASVMSLCACAAGGGDTGGEGGAGLMGGASGSGTGGVSAGGTGTGGSATGGTSGTGTGGAPGVGGSSGSVGVGGTSSTGGSTSVGGSSGVGGSTGGAGGSTGGAGGGTPNPDLIDDLEDNDGSIKPANGRIGAWYTYNDKTVAGTQVPAEGATFLPSPGGNNGSAYGAHTTGNGFATWGAGFGFDLNNSGGVATKGSWNAGAYTGIKFFAKGTPFRMKVLIPTTTPTADGGSCATTTPQCGDNHGMAIAATATWQEFVVPFASLVQEGWGGAAAFSAAAVIGIQFQVPKSTTFDIWIDDIGFY